MAFRPLQSTSFRPLQRGGPTEGRARAGISAGIRRPPSFLERLGTAARGVVTGGRLGETPFPIGIGQVARETGQAVTRPFAQLGVAAGRTVRGEPVQQPATLPGPLGALLGDVGIGTPKQEVGKAVESALTVGTPGVLQGGKGIVGTAARSGAVGALFGGAGAAQEEDATAADIAKGALIGGGLGAATGAVAGKFAPTASEVAAKREKGIERLTGKVTQQKDVTKFPAAQKAIKDVDFRQVKTFKDFTSKIDDGIAKKSRLQDELLELEGVVVKPSDTVKTFGKGKAKVSQNSVVDAFDDLETLYSTGSAAEDLARIKALRAKFEEQGLTIKEVNQLAREYGVDFKRKAFGKTGEPLTSVTAQRHENVRKGVKSIVGDFTDNPKVRELDKQMSDLFSLQQASRKMEEAVQNLKNKVADRGIIEGLSRKAGSLMDTITFGGPKAFISKFLVPSNVGQKTMNALEIERQLNKNLKKMTKLLRAKDSELIKQLSKKKL